MVATITNNAIELVLAYAAICYGELDLTWL
jgi:hypothetical protein